MKTIRPLIPVAIMGVLLPFAWSASAQAQGCPSSVDAEGWTRLSAWCPSPVPKAAKPSLTFTFIQDAMMSHGDTDRYGDRQGGEVVMRLPSAYLGEVLTGGSFVVGLKSVMDTSQAPRGAAGKLLQRDEVPAYAVLGYETGALGLYMLAGTVNDKAAVRTWNDVKLWEHSMSGPRVNRTSPLSPADGLLFGAQARIDEGIHHMISEGVGVSLVGTAFGQATTIKTEAGAAAHLALGNWRTPPRLAVSDLPMPDTRGTGAWIGIEASYVGNETVSSRAGTQPYRMGVVAGASLSLGEDWPTLSVSARKMLTEQVRFGGHSAVGEYRIGLSTPLPF